MSILLSLSAKKDVLLWKVFIFHWASNILIKKHNISFDFSHFISLTSLFFALNVSVLLSKRIFILSAKNDRFKCKQLEGGVNLCTHPKRGSFKAVLENSKSVNRIVGSPTTSEGQLNSPGLRPFGVCDHLVVVSI